MSLYYKRFNDIQKHMAEHGIVKRLSEIVQVYYKWKVSPYYEQWILRYHSDSASECEYNDLSSDSETAISQSENSSDELPPVTKRKNSYQLPTAGPRKRRCTASSSINLGLNEFNLNLSLDDDLNNFPSAAYDDSPVIDEQYTPVNQNAHWAVDPLMDTMYYHNFPQNSLDQWLLI